MSAIGETPRSKTGLALIAACSCVLVVTVNFSILTVALADILEGLGATTAELQWIISTYTVAFAALLLTGGTIGDRYGRVRTLRIGLVVLGIASVLAAFAPSPAFLIGARGVMGVAAAFITPMTMSIIATLSSDPRERARGIGFWSGASAVGLSIGPIAGGLLLEHFWWGSVFLLNTPIVIVLLLGSKVIPESRDPSPGRLDPVGAVLSVASMGALLFATIGAPEHGWASARTAVAYAIAMLLLLSFVVWELRAANPMLELGHLHNPRVSAPMSAAAMTTITYAGSLLIVSIMLRTVLGYGPFGTGVRLVPVALLMVVVGILCPRIAHRLGNRTTIALALVAAAAGAAVLLTIRSTTSYPPVLAAMLLFGFAFALGATPAADSVVGALPQDKAGVASGLNGTTRQFAQALGVAVLGSLLNSGYRSTLHREAPGSLSAEARVTAEESISGALDVARTLGPGSRRALVDAADAAFTHGVRSAAVASLIACAIGFVVAVRFIPSRARYRAESEAVRAPTAPPIHPTGTIPARARAAWRK